MLQCESVLKQVPELEGVFLKHKHINLLGWIVFLVIGRIAGSAFAALGGNFVMSPQPSSLGFCGIRALQHTSPELTGKGVLVAAVCRSMTYEDGLPKGDYRLNRFHQALRNGDLIFADGSDQEQGVSAHSTAIGGILVGNDSAGYHPDTGPFQYLGVCPDVSVDVYEFWRFVTLTVFGNQPFDADIITLSLGITFEDWWTRGIERLAQQKGILVVASAGNGNQVHDPLLYPAAGANVLAIGVLDAVQDTEGAFLLDQYSLPRPARSSYGPTADMRCKPDLVAPGRALVPIAHNYQDYEIRGDYSSFAAPIVAGSAALLVQEIRNDPNLISRIPETNRNCLIKSILMTSAQKLPWWHKGYPEVSDDHTAVLDYRQGAGALDINQAYQLLRSGLDSSLGWDSTSIEPSDRAEKAYEIIIPDPNGQILTATLNWNRHYKDQYPYHSLPDQDSNLRLELWAVDPNHSSVRIMVDYSDSVNDNVEHLYTLLDPAQRHYELVVKFSDPNQCPHDHPQPFAISWTIGVDQAIGHPSWYDLNDNGKQDPQDQMICFLLDHNLHGILNPNFLTEGLNIDADHANLLTIHWPRWKHYLFQWRSLYGNKSQLFPELETE